MITIFLLLALRILPFEIAHALSRRLVRLLDLVIGHPRLTAERLNDAKTCVRDAESLKKAAFNLAVMARMGTPFTRTLGSTARIEGEENIDRLRNRGDAGVIALFHYGPWELLAEIFTLRGYRIGAVVSGQKHGLLGRYLGALRRRAGLREISDLRKASTALREGIFVAALFDKTRRAKGKSVDLPYPGYRISVIPSLMAERTHMPLIPVICGFEQRKLWVKIGSKNADISKFFAPFFRDNPSEWVSWGD